MQSTEIEQDVRQPGQIDHDATEDVTDVRHRITWGERLLVMPATGWALALGSTFASSLVTPLVRGVVVNGMDPILLLLLRLVIAVALLAVSLLVWDRRRMQIDSRGLRLATIVGLIAGIEIGVFFSALAYVDASMSAMIKSTQPLVVLLLLALRGEALTGRHLVRLLLSTAGIYLLVGVGGLVHPFGLFLLCVSLLLYALQLVLTQWWLQGYDARTITLYIMSVMTAVVGVWWLAQGAQWETPGRGGWIVIGVLAVVSTYLARLALYAAIARIGSGQLALLWPLQTLLIILLSVLFLNERFSQIQAVGGLLIFASALLAFRGKGVERRPRPAT